MNASATQLVAAPRPSGVAGLFPGRILSLDVYRGLAVAGMILVDNPGNDTATYWPLKHADWNGWTPADLIFPSFLFIVGVSMVFSLSARLARGESPQKIFLHVIRRCLLLLLIGLFVNGFPLFDLHTMRLEGVVQRIALCYLVAAVLVLWTDWRKQLVALVICLAGYWALLRFVPVPGFGTPGRDFPFMDPYRNLPAWLDRKLFMGHLYNDTRDPEGLIHTIPAIGTALAGVLTGHWLRSTRSARAKFAWMVAAGVAGLFAGKLLDQWFPINKNLWTSSFVIFTAGFALVFLALLYWVLEIKRWRGAWTMPILVLGMNAIAGFVADALVYGPMWSLHTQQADGTTVTWMDYAWNRVSSLPVSMGIASLLYSAGALIFCWLLLWLLWRKRIFMKV